MSENQVVEVSDGVFAYLQRSGGWGWSNATMVVGDGSAALIDTLYDLHLTRAMLDTFSPLRGAAGLDLVVTTHANGDHCYGNSLVALAGVEVLASAAAAAEFEAVPPSLMAALLAAPTPEPLGSFLAHAFGAFDFEGIEVPPPTSTFAGTADRIVGGRTLRCVELGPAHTAGDVAVYLPEDGVVITGDLLFSQSTPVMWSGPLERWVAALQGLIDLDPDVVVPGHGPLTTVAGLVEARDYLALVETEVAAAKASGLTAAEAVRELDALIDQGPYHSWAERERLVVTVEHQWAHLDPEFTPADAVTLLSKMADAWAARR